MLKEGSVKINLFLTEKWDQAIFFFSFSVKWWGQHEEYDMIFFGLYYSCSLFPNLFFFKQSCLGSGNHFLCKAQKILTLYSPAQESHHLICFLVGIASRVAEVLSNISMIFHFPLHMFVLFIEVHHVLMSDKNKGEC